MFSLLPQDIGSQNKEADEQANAQKAIERIDNAKDTQYDTATWAIFRIEEIGEITDQNDQELWKLDYSPEDAIMFNKTIAKIQVPTCYIPKDIFTPKKGQLLYIQSFIKTEDGSADRFLITENNHLVHAQLMIKTDLYFPEIADNITFEPYNQNQHRLRNECYCATDVYETVMAGANVNKYDSTGQPVFWNSINDPEIFKATLRCGANLSLPHKYWKNEDGSSITVEDILRSNPDNFAEQLALLEKFKTGKLQKIAGKLDKDNPMLRNFLRASKREDTIKMSEYIEPAEIINVRTNAKDPQTGAKYKNALRVHDTKGNVIKSFYLPDNVQYIRDKRRREK